MCVSTGKAGTPKPCDITTLAVLCPTPGSFSRLLKLFGTFPSYFSYSILDNSEIDFDFFGPSPQGFMILYISSTLSLLIENASLPTEKSSGVILFTLSSVHCALSKTEISNSKLFLWFRGIGVDG